MKKPVLALIPSAYKTDKVYSVLPVNGDGDFSLSRDSGGSRVKENGLIEEITTINKPRLNWDGNCPSLLLEPSRTNQLQRSQEFSNSYWVNNGVTITENNTISPDGTLNADLLTGNSGGFSVVVFSKWSSTNNVASCFAKKGSTSLFKIANASSGIGGVTFDLENGIVTNEDNGFDSKIEKYDNGWFRCTAIDTLKRSGTFSLGVTDANESIYIWGAQLEQGAEPTSYIKTEGSIVTRSEEYRIETLLSGQTQFDKNKGVVFIDVNPLELETGQSSTISLQDGNYNILLFDFKANNILNFYINNAPSPGAVSYDYSHSGGRIKAAIGWSNGNYRLFANGQLLNFYTTSIEFSQLNSFQFNSYFGSYDFQGKVYGVQVFDELLSDAEIKKMTEL